MAGKVPSLESPFPVPFPGLGLVVRFCAVGFEFTALAGNKTHECPAIAAARRKTKMTMAGNKFLQFPTALQLPAAIFSGHAPPSPKPPMPLAAHKLTKVVQQPLKM